MQPVTALAIVAVSLQRGQDADAVEAREREHEDTTTRSDLAVENTRC
jgi:hypothetical protein